MAVVLSLLAAVLLGSAVAFQQHEAATVDPTLALRPTLLARLARRPQWLAAMAIDIAGVVAQVVALTIGSLVIVEPIITTNLLFSLVLAAVLAHRRLTRAQVRAALAVVAGLVVFLAVARPTAHSDAVAGGRDWLLMAATAVAVAGAGLGFGWAATGARRAAAFGLAAGTVEALMAVVAKAFGDRAAAGVGGLFRSWEPYALVGGGLVMMVVVQTSYQVGLPTVSLSVNAVAEPVVGVCIGLALFGETLHLEGGRGPIVLFALAVLAGGLVVLARNPVAPLKQARTSI